MSIFEENTKKAYEIFTSILPSYDSRKLFLINLKNSNYEKINLDENEETKIKEAVSLLVENARNDENRKLQQISFGPTLAMLRKLPTEIISEIKNSEKFFIQLIQLTVIFLFFKEIENEKHNHDHIREALLKKLEEIIPLL